MSKTTQRLDPVELDPNHYTAEAENDRVRVIRIKYGPGERSEMHSHPELVAVLLTDCHVRYAFPDGTTEEIHGAAGQAIALPSTTHRPENIGDEAFELIEIELKG